MRTGVGYRWVWSHPGDNDLEAPLWPILVSAADLLASKYVRSVRRCAGRGCGLVFVDRTTGSPRKWCAKDVCGARARALRRDHATIKPLLQEGRQRRRELRAARGDRSASEEPAS